MKKKRAEPFSWFTMDDGRRVRFDGTRFRDEVEKMKREKGRSHSDVYRGIVKSLHPECSRDEAEDKIDKVKKWYGQKNRPSNLLEIYKPMATFFNCEEDAFLKYEEIEEGHMMQTIGVQTNQASPNGCLSPISESKQLIRAMERAKEKEVAHELYGVLVDLIAAYLPIDEKIWVERRGEPGWLDKFGEYPKRYPADMAIRKTAPYLSKELRYQAQSLLDDMYGERTFSWQEASRFPLNATDQSSESFYVNKLKRFEEYVKQYGDDPEALDEDDRNDRWHFMMMEEDYELFNRLDDIFADYLCD